MRKVTKNLINRTLNAEIKRLKSAKKASLDRFDPDDPHILKLDRKIIELEEAICELEYS